MPASPEPVSVDVFDHADALARLGDDEGLLAEVQRLFVGVCRVHLRIITSAAT